MHDVLTRDLSKGQRITTPIGKCDVVNVYPIAYKHIANEYGTSDYVEYRVIVAYKQRQIRITCIGTHIWSCISMF